MIESLLIAVEPDDPSERVLRFGAWLGGAVDAETSILSVLEEPQRRDQLRSDYETQVRESIEQRLDWPDLAKVIVEDGMAAETILEQAELEAIDLIVLGTHRQSSLERVVLGSVAESVMQEATVPVLTVPPAVTE